MRILAVEDDRNVASFLERGLREDERLPLRRTVRGIGFIRREEQSV
jgi:hypothetical protein